MLSSACRRDTRTFPAVNSTVILDRSEPLAIPSEVYNRAVRIGAGLDSGSRSCQGCRRAKQRRKGTNSS